MQTLLPQDSVFWQSNRNITKPCRENLNTNVVIIGGGMAGLAAAQAFNKKGQKVVLLEQYDCGGGATGKSSGFITPNAEISFTDFSKRYNPEIAHQIWDFITSGVNDVRDNIANYKLDCDYAPQDTLILANKPSDLKTLEIEYQNLAKFGYPTNFYTKHQLGNFINSKNYFGAVSYNQTFGVNGYLYCQELKQKLISLGVQVFEQTTVTKIDNHQVITPHATITADYIVVCTDKFMPELDLLPQAIYHAQTFVMMSEELTQKQLRSIFSDKNLLVWDCELVYNYFRVTPQNRLLLGGGSVATTYTKNAIHDSEKIFKKLTNYFEGNFPGLNIQFKQMWPGLIGISKDIAPIAGRDQHKPYLYYVSASTGLPIAAALGRYSAENLIDNNNSLDSYFSPYRKFLISGKLQSLLGNKLSFALCNAIKKNIP